MYLFSIQFYSVKLVAKLIGPIADLGFEDIEVIIIKMYSQFTWNHGIISTWK